MMTDEVAYVLAGFGEKLAALRGKRIVLHGTREYAEAIIREYDAAFHFVAVSSMEQDDGFFCGKEVWAEERLLSEKPDAIILTERVRHAEEVYKAIGDSCRERGIALFDMYGLDWLAVRNEIDAQHARSVSEWLSIAAPFDVVVFELPNTVLHRNAPDGEGLLAPNRRIGRVVEKLFRQGKTVLFIGHGPYDEQVQVESLVASGLVPEGVDVRDVFVMRSGEDGSWRSICERYPQARILNIGHGIPKECILPRYYGVSTYRTACLGALGYAADDSRNRARAYASLDPLLLRRTLDDAIESCEVISFDVFDTLIQRETLVPEDVFARVEVEARDRGLPVQGFGDVRVKSFASDIYGIYRIVQEHYGLTDEQRDALMELELKVEREAIIPRIPVRDVFQSALDTGKRVFLVSDMYLPKEILSGILEDNGITGYERLLVSCDCGCSKQDGLFDTLLAAVDGARGVAHIGDSIPYDIEPAEELGIKAVLIPSARDIACAYGLGQAIEAAKTIDERGKLGRFVAETFGDPFEPRGLKIAGQDSPKTGSLFAEKGMIHVASHRDEIPVELRQALLAWYPFKEGASALFLGTDCEAFGPILAKRFETVDYQLVPGKIYDCIVVLDIQECEEGLRSISPKLARGLSDAGVLLVGFRNRFGIKYLCGGIDAAVHEPFETLTFDGASLHGPATMRTLFEGAGLTCVRTYGALPDASFTQAIYTDGLIPGSGIKDRVVPLSDPYSPLIAWEHDLYGAIVHEGMLMSVANYFLQAYCKEAAPLEPYACHVALSLDRGVEHSFITILFSDGTASKRAAYPEGTASLKAVFERGEELRTRGLLVIEQELRGEELRMPLVTEQSLMEHLERLLPGNPEEFLAVFDKLYRDILQSSDKTDVDDGFALNRWGARADELGPILRHGFIDMVPYNAFWIDGRILFFDQEFMIEDCPALYILFRAIHYTWIHLPQAERSIPLDMMKTRFGLGRIWDAFAEVEDRFVNENRNFERYGKLLGWESFDARKATRRRQMLLESADASSLEGGREKPYDVGLLMGVFDLFHVGHLRLIRRAKQRCRFLRVGVMSDDLVLKFKSIIPTIPQEQRMEIVGAIAEVDEVVLIDDDPSRIREWKRRPFDCFFSGDDYAGNEAWAWEKSELEKLGATIEFFPYTKEQSSSSIRKGLAVHVDVEAR